MIKIENVSTVGWEPAIRGARNPMNSWEKSDSLFANDPCNTLDDIFGETVFETDDDYSPYYYNGASDKKKQFSWAMDHDEKVALERWPDESVPAIGPNDLKLLTNLAKAGSDEAKFRRMIVVYLDVTAPMYWWKEADTYKVGTVRDSCSTMHKIHAKEFTLEDFSTEHLIDITEMNSMSENRPSLIVDFSDEKHPDAKYEECPLGDMVTTIYMLNRVRDLYLKTKDKKYWWQMIQLLPSSYNQRATLMLNYEVLANMYHARKNHKLDEWREFCKWIETLPYAKELIVGEERITDEQLRARFKSYEDRIRYLEEMSAKEFYRAYNMNVSDISEKLGIPESAVKYFVSDDTVAKASE